MYGLLFCGVSWFMLNNNEPFADVGTMFGVLGLIKVAV